MMNALKSTACCITSPYRDGMHDIRQVISDSRRNLFYRIGKIAFIIIFKFIPPINYGLLIVLQVKRKFFPASNTDKGIILGPIKTAASEVKAAVATVSTVAESKAAAVVSAASHRINHLTPTLTPVMHGKRSCDSKILAAAACAVAVTTFLGISYYMYQRVPAAQATRRTIHPLSLLPYTIRHLNVWFLAIKPALSILFRS